MERDFEKDIIELDAAIKSNAERDNTFTLSVLQRAKEIILQQKEKLKAYEDTGLEPEGILDSKLRANWIPVTERLPEIGEPVLVTLWDKDVTAGTWYGHRWGTTLCYNEGVLAWMSLPKPFSQQN